MPTQTSASSTTVSIDAMKESRVVKLVGIGGSLRPNSYTYKALDYAVELARDFGAELDALDLREMELPFCQAEGADEHPNVMRLRQAFREADGAILATPEYHGGPSGVLKNALDLLSFEELDGKVFGAISVLGGTSNSNALNQLRTIVRWVHGWMIPEQIAVGQAWQAFDGQGKIADAKLRQRFEQFALSLVESTCQLRGIPLPAAARRDLSRTA